MLFNELQGNPNSEMKETGIKWLRDTHSNKNYFCPEGLWSLLLWRYSRPVWTRSCAACSGWRCFGRGLDWVTHRGPFQPRPFCDSVIL